MSRTLLCIQPMDQGWRSSPLAREMPLSAIGVSVVAPDMPPENPAPYQGLGFAIVIDGISGTITP
jgi:hypothetical protein